MSTPPPLPARPRKPLWLLPLILVGAVIALGVATVLALRFTGQIKPFVVSSGAMAPALCPGDKVFAERMTLGMHPPARGEIVVLDSGKVPGIVALNYASGDWLTRVTALPGDKIEIRDDHVWINGVMAPELADRKYGLVPHSGLAANGLDLSKPVTVPENQCVVLGDKTHDSLDSRYWGFAPLDSIIMRYLCHYVTAADRSGVRPGRW